MKDEEEASNRFWAEWHKNIERNQQEDKTTTKVKDKEDIEIASHDKKHTNTIKTKIKRNKVNANKQKNNKQDNINITQSTNRDKETTCNKKQDNKNSQEQTNNKTTDNRRHRNNRNIAKVKTQEHDDKTTTKQK